MAYLIILNGVFLLAVIGAFREYRRTGLRCQLFLFLGGAIAFIGVVGTFGFMRLGKQLWTEFFGCMFLIPGLILGIIGVILFVTIESGAVQESYRGRSIFDIMSGNVSPLEPDKKYKPAIGRTMGMLLGFMATVGGIAQRLDDKSDMHFAGGYLILFGLALFVVSLLFLNRKDKEEEETDTAPPSEQKKIEATRGHYAGIVFGLIGIIAGAYKCFNAYPALSYSGIFLILLGLLMFVYLLITFKKKE